MNGPIHDCLDGRDLAGGRDVADAVPGQHRRRDRSRGGQLRRRIRAGTRCCALLRGRERQLDALAAEVAATASNHDASGPTEAAGIARIAGFFDRAVEHSPEASVALYSLGDPAILAAATDEIMRWLEAHGLLAPAADVLDLGCGFGRVAAALGPRCRSVLGLDVSGGMVAEARRRYGGVANLRFAQTGGQDLAGAAGRQLRPGAGQRQLPLHRADRRRRGGPPRDRRRAHPAAGRRARASSTSPTATTRRRTWPTRGAGPALAACGWTSPRRDRSRCGTGRPTSCGGDPAAAAGARDQPAGDGAGSSRRRAAPAGGQRRRHARPAGELHRPVLAAILRRL